MNKELFKKYEKLENEYREIEIRKNELREEIVKEMIKNKLDKAETDFGSFTVAYKKSWIYSKSISKIEDKLKMAKIKEQEKGIAESSETEYLLYKKSIK